MKSQVYRQDFSPRVLAVGWDVIRWHGQLKIVCDCLDGYEGKHLSLPVVDHQGLPVRPEDYDPRLLKEGTGLHIRSGKTYILCGPREMVIPGSHAMSHLPEEPPKPPMSYADMFFLLVTVATTALVVFVVGYIITHTYVIPTHPVRKTIMSENNQDQDTKFFPELDGVTIELRGQDVARAYTVAAMKDWTPDVDDPFVDIEGNVKVDARVVAQAYILAIEGGWRPLADDPLALKMQELGILTFKDKEG